MSEGEKGFRGALVGGFQRDDVLQYIESTAKEHEETVQHLTEELETIRDSLREMTDKSNEATTRNAELLEKLGAMTIAEDEAQTELQNLREQLDVMTMRAHKAEEAEAVLTAEKEVMVEELTELRAKREEFEASKDHLAEIELCAYRRAKELERQSKMEAEKLREQSAEVINRVKNKIDAANDSCRDILKRSQTEADEMARRASQLLKQLESVSGKLEAQKSANQEHSNGRLTLSEVLSGLRQNTEEK